MEYLEVASSFEAQRQYQEAAPASVPNEMINQWEDWVTDAASDDFSAPVYSPEERQAVATFQEVWSKVVVTTPNSMPPLEETLRLDEWDKLRSAAEATLGIFRIRGRLPEDEEI